MGRCSRNRRGYPGGLEARIRGKNDALRHSVFNIRFDGGLPEGFY